MALARRGRQLLRGVGGNGNGLLLLEVPPFLPQAAGAPPSFPDPLVAVWMLAVSRKKTLTVGLTFSAQAAGKHPGENVSRETRPLGLAAVLSSAVTLSFFPSPQSGGRIITLEGKGFELVQNVSMVVRGIGREQTVSVPAGCHPGSGSRAACPVPGDVGSVELRPQPVLWMGLGARLGGGTQDVGFFDVRALFCFQSCKVHTDTMITCPSPAASNVTAGSKPAPVDFYLNGRLYADDHPALDKELYPEEALHISKFSLEYYADPQFFTAKKEKWIKHHPGEPLTLVIHVRAWRLQPCFFWGVPCWASLHS